MNLLVAYVVDDEIDNLQLLQQLLKKNCPQIGIIECFTNPLKAINAIELHKPDILFLDIEMPQMNGFELLEKIINININVIFITAYNQYAIKAFRLNAIDYLLKPISTIELIDAVEKAIKASSLQVEQLINVQKEIKGTSTNKIAVTTKNGIDFLDLENIVYIEANGNYSKIYLKNAETFIISKTLKSIQDLFEESFFYRIHRQYIINLKMIKHFNRNECILTMDNKVELPVAKIQKDKLIDKFNCL
jgi:two-component system LytT family response regulator